MTEFYSGRGGKREGAGRKKGVKIGKIKPETVMFARRVTPNQRLLKIDTFSQT